MKSVDHQISSTSKPQLATEIHRDTCKKATRSLCAKDSFPALKRNIGKAKSDDLQAKQNHVGVWVPKIKITLSLY